MNLLFCPRSCWSKRFCLLLRKVMEQCDSFKEDPMETNNAPEVNFGPRG